MNSTATQYKYIELNADMQRRFEKVEALRQQAGESALVKKLRSQGLIK
jgi:hypothetical protein